MAAPDPFSSLYLLTPSHHLTYPNSHRSQSLSPTESESGTMSCSLSSTDFVWQWASVSFVADTLALICPLCVLCLTISACLNRLKSSFVSSHHFTLTFHNSLNPFHPHPHCVVSSSLQLGLKSLFRWDITTHELKGGNSTVVALYWECPAAGVKTVTIVSYRRSKTSQLWFNLLIVASPRWREDCHYRQ